MIRGRSRQSYSGLEKKPRFLKATSTALVIFQSDSAKLLLLKYVLIILQSLLTNIQP